MLLWIRGATAPPPLLLTSGSRPAIVFCGQECSPFLGFPWGISRIFLDIFFVGQVRGVIFFGPVREAFLRCVFALLWDIYIVGKFNFYIFLEIMSCQVCFCTPLRYIVIQFFLLEVEWTSGKFNFSIFLVSRSNVLPVNPGFSLLFGPGSLNSRERIPIFFRFFQFPFFQKIENFWY